MNLFFLLALLSLTAFVSLYDLHHARIPNWATIPLLILGLIANSPHPLGIYIILLSFWIAWKLGWMGAGDAKLWMGLIVSLPAAYQMLWAIPLVFFATAALQLLWRKVRGKTLAGVRSPGAWRTPVYMLVILVQELHYAY
ncbi:MAG: prepilin peptidase [Anaerolineales bacterium]|uniref:Prepilin peptidase n=1 Tax=Candidatus Desulfolinea nitratireducens TaxID=2841698 RepID=A0A8J6NJ03_9CHLR|nr:prepilin peptidase [Candidatus Desulfolinea nitratireducens]MBL6960229.1 prepilin peptidase [Anaerolineales bacterium]